MRKISALVLILCLAMCFTGCSSKKKSTAPVLFVFSKTNYSDGNATYSLFINEDGEYFTVGPSGTYTLSEFDSLSDVPSFEKSGVVNGTIYTELSEYKVEGELFTADEINELKDLLEQIPSDAPYETITMPEYEYTDFPSHQTILITAHVEGEEYDSLWLLSLFNLDGGERPKAPNTYIGDCINDENGMKIAGRILERVPLKDIEREYYSKYPDYLDAG